MASDFRFQIDLRGIIGVLSASLYSGPKVFVRELLQNATDAIRARAAIDPQARGVITVETLDDTHLTLTDTGIGLTEADIHQFLATIGASSKREALGQLREDFIGNFGIGLLSCFMVSDEIVMITRSAHPGHPAHEWRGRSDGTYSVRKLDSEVAPGTTVHLKARDDAREYFRFPRLRELLRHYGKLLPFPIQLSTPAGQPVTINETPPWKKTYASVRERKQALMAFAQSSFGQFFVDVIEIRTDDGSIEGIGVVLPETPAPSARSGHRIYLKGMLLTEKADGLLPDWAFFVRLLINVTDLHPAASRESFHEDDALEAAQQSLSNCLQDYLLKLADEQPEKLRQLISTHYLSIKALAVQDEEVYRVFIDYLPFETTMGTLTLPECLAKTRELRYVTSHDQFRQVAQIMSALDSLVIDAGYTYDKALIEGYGFFNDDATTIHVDATQVVNELDELSDAQREATSGLLDAASEALKPHRCRVEIRRFRPEALPTVYSVDASTLFRRDIERTRESVGGLWSDVLGDLGSAAPTGAGAQLCLNYENALVQRLARLPDRTLVKRIVDVLYVQALLLGHHPLGSQEMKVLTSGLGELINIAVEREER